jgi:hypothetical protein
MLITRVGKRHRRKEKQARPQQDAARLVAARLQELGFVHVCTPPAVDISYKPIPCDAQEYEQHLASFPGGIWRGYLDHTPP